MYSKAGMYLCAARVDDSRAITDNSMYWAAVASAEEGRFLCAILNSPSLTNLVAPLQARGEHNPRHFDKYVWQLPIPLFDPSNGDHVMIAELGGLAEAFVAELELPQKRFGRSAGSCGRQSSPSRRSVGRSTSA